MTETSVEIHREEGRNFRSVTVTVSDTELTVSTQDMGPLVEEMWGDEDYEFWTKVPREAWGPLLLALIRAHFGGRPDATDRLRDLCRENGIDHEWDSWA